MGQVAHPPTAARSCARVRRVSIPAEVATSLFGGIVDDAALFPPGNEPMGSAVPAHRNHQDSWYGTLVGPFLCADRWLAQLQAELTDDTDPLAFAVIVTGGAGAVEPAVSRADRDPRLQLAGVEVALRSADDLAANARRVATVFASTLPDGVVGSVEVPRLEAPTTPSRGWLAALDVVAEAGHRLKYRTGGLEPTAFPSELELATVLNAALDRELPVKCTAGLHDAVRHTATDTGFEQHGFLNVLLAVRAALDGADVGDLAAVLADRDRDAVSGRVRDLDAGQAASVRRWFTSFGSCSVLEPVDNLVELGLLSKESLHA